MNNFYSKIVTALLAGMFVFSGVTNAAIYSPIDSINAKSGPIYNDNIGVYVTHTGADNTASGSISSAPMAARGERRATLGILNQPVDLTTCTGTRATFAVVIRANDAAKNLTFRWQESTDGGATFNDVVNNNGVIYTPSYDPSVYQSRLSIRNIPQSMSGYKYQCIVTANTDPVQTVTSNVGTLTVGPFVANLTTSDVSCNGKGDGVASIAVSGGMAPYSYYWSTGAGTTVTSVNTLSGGSFSVQVTDANGYCTTNKSFTINEPGVLSATITPINVTCNGLANGSITVQGTGGTAPYTYEWKNAGGTVIGTSELIENLSSGTYNLKVTDAKNCTYTTTQAIAEPTALTATAFPVMVQCFGLNNGDARASASGGTTPYTYKWFDAGGGERSGIISGSQYIARNLGPGNYTIKIKDANGCSWEKIVYVQEPTPISATLTPTNVTCNNGSDGKITIAPSGGVPAFTYNWTGPNGYRNTSTYITNIKAGSYTVTLTDANACTYTPPAAVITQPDPITADISATPVSCHGGNDGTAKVENVTGGTAPYSYSWSPSGGTDATATGLIAGDYTVTITDSKGCTLTKMVTVNQSSQDLGVNENLTMVACKGNSTGAITLEATGGTAPYTYTWANGLGTDPGLTNLPKGSYSVTIRDAYGCVINKTYEITEPDKELKITSVLQINVSCYGGSNGVLLLSVAGGTSPYSYSWSTPTGYLGTATGLSPNDYSYTVTDAKGCFVTDTRTITQPTKITLSTDHKDVLCKDGTTGEAKVIVTGGTPGYYYSWSPGNLTTPSVQGLTAGTYTVTVNDNNSCSETATVEIKEPTTALSASVTPTHVLCNGFATGGAEIAVNGGTPGYTYKWIRKTESTVLGTQPTISGLTAGTYTVTATDANGCIISEDVTINEPAALIATKGDITNVACFGNATGAATVNVTGGTGAYTYTWSPAAGTGATASSLTAGTYTVTVKDDNQCTATQTFEISQPAALTVVADGQTNVFCKNGSNGIATVKVAGGATPYSYAWSPAGGNAATATGLAAGVYTVKVTDNNGCEATQAFTITEPATEFKVTPQVTDVACKGANSGAIFLNTTGGATPYLYEWEHTPLNGPLTINLVAGDYKVKVTDANNCVWTKDFTITEPATVISSTLDPVTQPLCAGSSTGAASVTAQGGTGAYTYAWFPNVSTTASATNLSAGEYQVRVYDANNCFTDQFFTLDNPLPLTITPSQTNLICKGAANGSATVAVTGGTGAYTYSWSPSGGTDATASGLSGGTYTVTVKDANGCEATQVFTITEPAEELTATISKTNVSCKNGTNGTAKVEVSGGGGAYTYVWSPAGGTDATATGLAAGDYSVVIRDANGCSITKTIRVDEPRALTITSPLSNNVKCKGEATGSISVVVDGGQVPYTLSWASSASPADGYNPMNLRAGDYTITVTDDNQCQATKTFTITEPTAIVTQINFTDALCSTSADGKASVTSTTGGMPPYSYSWTGGRLSIVTGTSVTGLIAGDYTLYTKDSYDCIVPNSFHIGRPENLLAVLEKTDVTCKGLANGTAKMIPNGGTAPYTYQWSVSGITGETATGLAPGDYSVTVTDAHGCTYTRSFSITEPSAVLAVTKLYEQNVSCNGGTNGAAIANVSGGNVPYTYQWSPAVGEYGSASNLSAGTYTFMVTDSKNCQSNTITFTITEPEALQLTSSQTNVSCKGTSTGAISVEASGGAGSYIYEWPEINRYGNEISGLAAGDYKLKVRDINGCVKEQTFTITEPSFALSLTPSQTDPKCNGSEGSVLASVSGGTGAYSYVWSNGNTTRGMNVPAGTYTVTVKDENQCEVTNTYTITEPPALEVTLNPTNVSCKNGTDGQISVNVTGGTSPYNYSWSNSATTPVIKGLGMGGYQVTVTDFYSCLVTKKITITEPDALTVTSTQTNVSCKNGSNGSATLNVTGGTGAYTYNWAPSGGTGATATGLKAGTYTVSVKDAKLCETTYTVKITEPDELTVSVILKTDVLCNNAATGVANVATNGGSGGVSYEWSPAVSTGAWAYQLRAGDYTVTVKDTKQCVASTTFSISEPPALVVTKGTQTNASCNGGTNGSATVIATGGKAPYTYNWSPSGRTNATATGLAAGDYEVTVTDANGCSASQTFNIKEPAAIIATVATTNATCSDLSNGSATVTVSGGTGGYTYSWSPYGGTASTATGLKAGDYTVTITDAKNCQKTQSVTITAPPALELQSVYQTDVLCYGLSNGSINVGIGGGTPPYTYSWSGRNDDGFYIGSLKAGAYKLTATDKNNCQLTHTFNITQPPAIIVTPAQTNVKCKGGTNGRAAVEVSGGTAPYTYSWSNGAASEDIANLAAGNYNVTVRDANNCEVTTNFTITEPDEALTATKGNQTNISCNQPGGSATVKVTGGTAPYTYSWSPAGGTAATATNLGAGAYTVTVKDANQCTATQSFIIISSSDLVITPSQTNVNCSGASNGTATVEVTGGTGTYSYLWSNGATAQSITDVKAGNYSVTVTDGNNCKISHSFTITEPAALSATTKQTNITCKGTFNGTATVTVTGGTGAYTYQWSPSGGTEATAAGLAAGTYTLTIKDANQCQVVKSVKITEPATTLTTTKGAQTNITCSQPGGSATVNVTGGTAPYTYSWSPAGGTAATAANLDAGTYTVTVKDANQCESAQSFTITSSSSLVVIPAQTEVTCNGSANGAASVSVTGGTGTYTYLWSNGSTAKSITGIKAGNYSVTVTDGNNCKTTYNFTITEPAALNATTKETNISCKGASNGTATITVTGGTGAYTYQWSPSGGTGATASGLAPGNYTITVKDVNQCQVAKTVTITEPATALTATKGAQTNITCSQPGGSATVNVTGGAAPYTYLWSPAGGTAATAANLGAGTYTVTVKDANLCEAKQNFTITSSSSLVVTPAQTNVTCNGNTDGAASVTVTGGTGTYTYQWSNGSTAKSITGVKAGNYSVTVTDGNNCKVTHSFTITEPVALNVTTKQTNITCKGTSNGTATITVTGGTGAYTYQWSPAGGTDATASGLAAGTYTVTVKDAGQCQVVKIVTITEPATALTATKGAQTNITCSQPGGSATVNVTGGAAPYTYLWSPAGGTAATAANLGAGTYTVTVKDANLCEAKQNFTITSSSSLVVTPSQTEVTCNGSANGAASVSVTGGTGTYTYLWSNGSTAKSITGVKAGNYSVTVTDGNNCKTAHNFTITEPAALNATTKETNISCKGASNGTATITVTGGIGAYTYQWSPSGGTAATASGLAPGNYTITVKDANQCQVAKTVTITEPATALTATKGAQTNITCSQPGGSATVNVTGGAAPYTYLWSPAGGTAATAANLGAGTYTVTVKDANQCQATQSFTITSSSSLVVTPSQTEVTCNGSANGAASVSVTGGTGTYTYQWSQGGTGKSITGVKAGNYSVTVTDGNNCQVTHSFTITEPAMLEATTKQTNITCKGAANGTAAITVTGGTGAYTYQWSPTGGTAATASGLAAGTYTITVKDAGQCLLTKTVMITEPAVALTATKGAQVNITCSQPDGSATVNVTGGTAPYTYSWSPAGGIAATASNLGAGTYTVTVKDANQCQATQTFTITSTSDLKVTPSQTNVSCHNSANGSATVNVTGGTGTYTYLWSQGGTGKTITGLKAGDYSVVITDGNNCKTTQSFTIVEPVEVTMTITATGVSAPGTADATATAVVTGGVTPYAYLWTPGGATTAKATGLSAQVYTCQVTDANGCTVSQSVKISGNATINVAPAITKTYGDPVFKLNVTSNSTGAFSFRSSNAAIVAVNGGQVTILRPGTATITIEQAADANYGVTTAKTVITVDAKTLQVSLLSSPIISKEYDGTVLATIAKQNYSISGVINGDQVTVSGTAKYAAGNKGDAIAVTWSDLVLSGTQAAYYKLSQTTVTGVGQILPRPLTVKATAAAKVYGENDPQVFNYTITAGSGVVTGDAFTGKLLRDAGENVNKYQIKQGDLALSSNYVLTYVSELFEIKKATLTIRAEDKSMEQGAALPLLSYVYSGFVRNESSSVLTTLPSIRTTATSTSIPGTYPIILDGGSAQNYDLQLKNGTLTILAKNVNHAPAIDKIADQEVCFTDGKLVVPVTGLSTGGDANQTITLAVQSDKNIFSTLEIVANTATTAVINYVLKDNVSNAATITVTVKDNGGTANGGIDQVTTSFIIKAGKMPEFTVNSNRPDPVFPGTAVTLTTTGNANVYTWSANGAVIEEKAASVTVLPTSTTTYEVIGKLDVCSTNRLFVVNVTEIPAIIPNNVITPNGDGSNDRWTIKHIELFPDNEVKIFDQAGRLVYQRKGYRNEWDGSMDGRSLQTGTYIYIIKLKDKPEVKGYLTIVR